MTCHGTLFSMPRWRSKGQSSGWSSDPIKVTGSGSFTYHMSTGDPQFAQNPRFTHGDDW